MLSKLKFYNKMLVYFIDPSIKFIKREKNCSLGVFEVERDNKKYILKVAANTCNFGFEHIKRDIMLLSLCQDLKGIPKLFKTYNKKGYLALLREFIEGNKAYELNNSQKKQLEGIVKNIHKSGFARLELCPPNIILSENKPLIIDFGHSLTSREVDQRTFHRLKYEDLITIKNYSFPTPLRIY